MDNLNDLKKIWLTANTTSLPNSTEIMRMGKKFRNQKLIKKVAVIMAGVLLTIMMVGIMVFYQSQMITTRIGEGCIIIACGILVYTNINSIGRFLRYKDYNNKEFIAFLEQTRLNQIYFYQKTQVIALTFCTVGLALYLVETVLINLVAGLIIYLVSGMFLAINWFVIRPRTFRKQKEKLDEIIKKLEKISSQL